VRISLVTDAWFPQINGVVRTLNRVKEEVEAMGHRMAVVAPPDFRTIPCPTYPEIRLSILPNGKVRRILDSQQPQAIHIATEGPLGMAARSYCKKRKLPFTTSYHTRFPEYVSARFPAPLSWGHGVMRWFHKPSSGVMVATPSLERELAARRFTNVRSWTRGVDLALFRPRPEAKGLFDLPRPIFIYIGRVAVEKNIKAFLELDLPGSKVVVGGGPALEGLKQSYPSATFTGPKVGEELAMHYAAGDVFVFPSLTDTFGLVLLEAMASGLPVAAFPVTGPLDVVGEGGVLNEDLRAAALAAMQIPPEQARAHAETYSWPACARLFLDNLAPFA